jgi:hypothetical protein
MGRDRKSERHHVASTLNPEGDPWGWSAKSKTAGEMISNLDLFRCLSAMVDIANSIFDRLAPPCQRAYSTSLIFGRRKSLRSLLAAALLFMTMPPAKAELQNTWMARRDRLTLGFFFTASQHLAAFPVRVSGTEIDVMLIDLESGARIKLASKGFNLLSPSLSNDGERILLVRNSSQTGEYALLSCVIANFSCRRLVESKASINSPTEICPGTILYVSSPRKVLPGVRSQYQQHDLWILGKDESPRQLTDFRFFEMDWLSPTSGSIFFSAMGPRDKQTIPKFAPLASSDSDIFRLTFNPAQCLVEQAAATLTPLFLGNGRSTAATVAGDETIAALLRTETRVGGYRYDLVIMDLLAQGSRVFESSGLGFSRPALVDRTVVVREIFDDRYVISRLPLGDPTIKPIAEITDASIASTQVIEIQVEPERQ